MAASLLRDARRRAGLSQRELARASGVAQPLVSAYESGARQPGADMLLRLLAATGHAVELRSTVEGSRDAARKLEQVVALASALPARQPGPLAYPPWSTVVA